MIHPGDTSKRYTAANDGDVKFVMMTPSRVNPEKFAEHICSLCHSVQIEGGFSYNLPDGFIQIICLNCYSEDKEFTEYCEGCDAPLDEDNHYDTYDITNDYGLPNSIENRASICKGCMNTGDEIEAEVSTPESVSNKLDVFQDIEEDPADELDKRIEEIFDRIEARLDEMISILKEQRNITIQPGCNTSRWLK